MKIEQLASTLGATEKGGNYRFFVDEIEFQITYIQMLGIKQYMVSTFLNKNIRPSDVKAIKNSLGFGYNVLVGPVHGEGRVITINYRKKGLIEKLTKVVDILKTLGFQNEDKDIFNPELEATGERTFKLPYMNTQYQILGLMIPANLEKYKLDANHKIEALKKEAELSSDKFLPSLFLALFGAILGALPSIIIYFAGFMSWFLYLIIPFMSFYMYKKGKGPKKGFVPIVIGVISILVGVGSLLFIWTMFAGAEGYTLREILAIDELSSGFFQDIMFCVVGNILGVFVSFKYIYNQTVESQIKNIETGA